MDFLLGFFFNTSRTSNILADLEIMMFGASIYSSPANLSVGRVAQPVHYPNQRKIILRIFDVTIGPGVLHPDIVSSALGQMHVVRFRKPPSCNVFFINIGSRSVST